jgi:2-C-methyl-D-erythritol 4-phosphate cytidylyltransferase
MAAHGRLTVAAIVVAGGSGSRLGTTDPKAFATVAGRPLLEYAVDRIRCHSSIRDVVVAPPVDHLRRAVELVPSAVVVAGGATRQQSVAAGLAALADDVDVVLVHDVARAFVPLEVIGRVLDAIAAGADGAVPVLPVVDSMRQTSETSAHLGAVVDRASLVSVQTPQGFRRGLLVTAHAAAPGDDATDDATLVEAVGGRLVAVAGAAEAFKITHPVDLLTAEAVVTR